MSNFFFQHTFLDGRVMTVAVKRNGGLPKIVCTPKFKANDDADYTAEYLAWRNEIFATLIELLDEAELLSVITLGVDPDAA